MRKRTTERVAELGGPAARGLEFDDGVRGWRTGRIDRVLDGDFDLFEAEPEEQA